MTALLTERLRTRWLHASVVPVPNRRGREKGGSGKWAYQPDAIKQPHTRVFPWCHRRE